MLIDRTGVCRLACCLWSVVRGAERRRSSTRFSEGSGGGVARDHVGAAAFLVRGVGWLPHWGHGVGDPLRQRHLLPLRHTRQGGSRGVRSSATSSRGPIARAPTGRRSASSRRSSTVGLRGDLRRSFLMSNALGAFFVGRATSVVARSAFAYVPRWTSRGGRRDESPQHREPCPGFVQ